MMQLFVIPMTPPSLNEWYAGKHWKYRAETKNIWQKAVMVICRNAGIRPVKSYPARMTCLVHFKNKKYRDPDNYITANKLVTDGLKTIGILVDDASKFMSGHTISITEEHENDETVVMLFEDVPVEVDK